MKRILKASENDRSIEMNRSSREESRGAIRFALCTVMVVVVIAMGGMTAAAQSSSNLLAPYLPSSEADLWNFDKFHEKQWMFCTEDGSEAMNDDNTARLEYAYFSQMQNATRFKYCYNNNALQTFVIDPAEGFASGDMILTLGYPEKPTNDGLIQYFYRVPIPIEREGKYTLTGAARLPEYSFASSAFIQEDHDAVDLSHCIVFVAVKEGDGSLAFESEPLYGNIVKITGVTCGDEPRPFFAKWLYDNEEADWWVSDDKEPVPEKALPFTTTLNLTTDYKYLRIYAPKDGNAIPINPVAVNNLCLTSDVENSLADTFIPDDAPAQYFTLQGVRVNNPIDGVFIEVKNGKATKILR